MSVNIQTSSGLVKIAGTPTIDTALSNVSKNPVQNKVVTEKFDEINSEVTQINSNLDQLEIDLKMLGYTVPKEMPVQNYVDADGVFHQRVGRVDLGSLNWEYKTTWFHAYLNDCKAQPNGLTKPNIYCSSYDTVIWTKIGTVDKTIGVTYAYDHSIGITDTSYTDATTLNNAMKGVYLYYELETEITTNVDGNEAVTRINESLGDYGLNNVFDDEYKDGFYENDGKYYYNAQWKTTKNSLIVSSENLLSINLDSSPTYARIVYFDDSNTFVSYENFNGVKNAKLKVPSGATKCYISMFPNTRNIESIYVDNAIDSIKNDLAVKPLQCIALRDCVIDKDLSYKIGNMFFVCVSFTINSKVTNWSYSPFWINERLISNTENALGIYINGTNTNAFIKPYSSGVSLVVENLEVGSYIATGMFPII